MAGTDKRRQKKLAKHKAKRNEKRRKLARVANVGFAQRLASLATAPILDCRIMTDGLSHGMAGLMISRERGGVVAFAVFLLDTYCLGVKDSYGHIKPISEYRDFKNDWGGRQTTRAIDPSSARKLIDDAVEFAASIGFSPRGEYHRVRSILAGIDPDQADESFEMGNNGKPTFINGPHDTPDFCRRVAETLERKCGAGNYNVVRMLSEPHIGSAGLEDIELMDDELLEYE